MDPLNPDQQPPPGTGNTRRPAFAFARRNGVCVTALEADHARVAYRPGASAGTFQELRRSLGVPLRLERMEPEAFEQLLQRTYERGSGETQQIVDDIGDDLDLARIAESLPEPEDLLESEDDAPVIRLINAILTESIKENASDIHIEPFENRLVVRFRVDGVLREVLEPQRALAPLLISRIKVMARLDIAEKRLPQDGRIGLRVAGRAVDIRVSTLPSGHGERVVLRLLDKQAGRLDLKHLGMPEALRQPLDTIIHRPHGIVLVTGPTGSGKTTTLYAALTELNDQSRSILTVEDPIEYYLEGIGQTQVNTKVDMTFARGLRAILRQDPDVVMVGEIRDLETAEIAVQASLTGHVVLSTLHTNTAVGAVSRLRDMGVEPFLLASSVIGLMSQRLVRMLCDHCKAPYTPNPVDCATLGINPDDPPTLYRAVGCSHCNQQGYRGRGGIFELIPVDERVRTMIHDGETEQAIERYARERTPSMRQDGVRRILAGQTTIDEVLRVTIEDTAPMEA
ncbi:type II secretion system ATPase GspE [Aquisalimonas asiatica]|uniref:Type II secretion system protein E n=1 Tax=Aquisalimonas asiatica TaxID=406100 RepID=A0A1H8VL66_9GAMM|nr:type II secretion system ATPase GspE [Aquisalimonas asiatica]SEP16129.1 type II secretion system protein E (GspE) [Aquisalimonas asiatica]